MGSGAFGQAEDAKPSLTQARFRAVDGTRMQEDDRLEWWLVLDLVDGTEVDFDLKVARDGTTSYVDKCALSRATQSQKRNELEQLGILTPGSRNHAATMRARDECSGTIVLPHEIYPMIQDAARLSRAETESAHEICEAVDAAIIPHFMAQAAPTLCHYSFKVTV